MGRDGMVLRAAEILPLIQQAGTLIINGDAAELHVREYRDQAVEELARLRELCDQNETRLILLAGNHDPEVTPERYIIHEKKGVFITHGDVVEDSVAPWSDAAERMRQRHREFSESMTESERNTLESSFHACREASVAEWSPNGDADPPSTALNVLLKPKKLIQVLRFWRQQARLMNAFAEQFVPSARLILIGHSHRPLVKKVGHRVIVNTGCFGFPGKPLAGIFDTNGFHARRVIRSGDCWTLASKSIYEDQSILFDESALSEAVIGPKDERTNDVASFTTERSTPVAQPSSSQ
jgi:predicted phosphodiesterase